MSNRMKDELMDIVHIAAQAMVADEDDVQRRALELIADGIASVLPVETASAVAPVERKGMEAFLRFDDRLRLIRFRGKDFVKLLGRVPAHDGSPATCYEIRVPKGRGSAAFVYRNDDPLFGITGTVNSCLMEQMAVSALHRWWKTTREANKRSHKKTNKEVKHENQ